MSATSITPERAAEARANAAYVHRREVMLRGFADYEIPEHMRDGVLMYALEGRYTGGFLTRVLSNDGLHAAGCADRQNLAALGRWFCFIHACTPSACNGSETKVAAWIEAGGLLGVIAGGGQ